MDEEKLFKDLEEPPEKGTGALVEYFWAQSCDQKLFSFVIDTVLKGDAMYHVAKNALAGKAFEKKDPVELAKNDPGPRTIALRESNQELVEMFLCRLVDSFQIYLVSIIRSALYKQPRILSSSKLDITLGHVLQFDTVESLVGDVIEGKVTSLSYEGFGELESWCQNKGIPIIVPDGYNQRIVELIAIRNLIVHNRNIVDARFKKMTGISVYSIGEKRLLEVDDLILAIGTLNKVATCTDSAVSGKFSLRTVDLRKELEIKFAKRWPRKISKSSDVPTREKQAEH